MAKIRVILAMIIFGTIGTFVTLIDYPSELIALFRAVLGTLVLVVFMLISRKKPSLDSLKKNLFYLLTSGVLLGLNWIFLFEAYRFSGVTVGTLCYYMAPVFVILLSPIVLKKKATPFKNLCAVIAVAGMVLLVGVERTTNFTGVFFGITAGLFYAFIIMINSRTSNISSFDTTVFQLGISAIVILPYVISKYDISDFSFDTKSIIILILLGVVHTGIAYLLYFGAINKLPPQTTAIYGYIDPVVALVLSTLILSEPIGFTKVIGALLILGSAFVADIKKEE